MKEQPQMHKYKSFSYILYINIFVALSILPYSYGINCMNNPLKLMIVVFDISEEYKGLVEGLLQCSIQTGSFIGAIIGIYVVTLRNRVGMLLTDGFMLIGSSMLFINNIYVFLIGRVVMGIGCGLSNVVVAVWLKQFTPREIYGIMGGLNSIIFGLLITQSLGFAFQNPQGLTKLEINSYWKFYFTLIPGSICFIKLLLLHKIVQFESSQYYAMIQNGKILTIEYLDQKIVDIVSKVYKKEYIQTIYEQVKDETDNQKSQQSLFKKPYARRVYFGMLLQFITQNTGFMAIMQYSTFIFNDIFSESLSRGLTFSISIVKCIIYFACINLAQKYGKSRRPFMLYGNFTMLIANLAIGALSLYLENGVLEQGTQRKFQYGMIFFILLFFLGNFFSLPCLVPVYVPEITPGKGVAYSWVVSWFSAIYILLVFPIIKQYIGMSFSFFYFGFIGVISQVVMQKYLMETKDKSEEEIGNFFYKKTPTIYLDQHLIS